MTTIASRFLIQKPVMIAKVPHPGQLSPAGILLAFALCFVVTGMYYSPSCMGRFMMRTSPVVKENVQRKKPVPKMTWLLLQTALIDLVTTTITAYFSHIFSGATVRPVPKDVGTFLSCHLLWIILVWGTFFTKSLTESVWGSKTRIAAFVDSGSLLIGQSVAMATYVIFYNKFVPIKLF